MLIAEALGLIRIAADAQTGVSKAYLCTADEDGFAKMEEVGASLERMIQNPDSKVVETVKQYVENRLSTDLLHKNTRDELLENVRNSVQERIRGLADNDPKYKEQREGFTRVKEILTAR